MSQAKITRQDLENRLRDLQGDLSQKVEDSKQALVAAGVAAGILVLLIVFLLGRRAGKKKTTFVEIRRV